MKAKFKNATQLVKLPKFKTQNQPNSKSNIQPKFKIQPSSKFKEKQVQMCVRRVMRKMRET